MKLKKVKVNLDEGSQPGRSSGLVHPLTIPRFQAFNWVIANASVKVSFQVVLILQQRMVSRLRWFHSKHC